MSNSSSHDAVRAKVREGYSKIATEGVWVSVPKEQTSAKSACCSGGGCCGGVDSSAVAKGVGYTEAELALLPEGANMGLSCGNPTAIASLKPGEVVLDLGAGGGFDCFVAGPKVGAGGRVIGVDMTAEMVSKARGNLDSYRRTSGLDNVEFRLGEIEHLPVADASVDVVISNCVINLSPNKEQVWKEIARVLKPGGRVAVSDLALLRPLPESVRQMVEALVGCVSGAVLIDETRDMMQRAGLKGIELRTKSDYITAMTDFQDPLYRQISEHLPKGTTVADFVTSLDATARKQGGAACCGPGCCG